MDRKRISSAGLLVALFSMALSSRLAEAQSFGNPCPPACDCDRQCGVAKAWNCLYGRMVSDGFGGSFRLYGYPTPPCCCRPPCCYPVWGTDGACPYGCPHPGIRPCPHRRNYGYHASSSRRSLSSPGSGIMAACCTSIPMPCCTGQPVWCAVEPAYPIADPKPVALPATLMLASTPTPIHFAN